MRSEQEQQQQQADERTPLLRSYSSGVSLGPGGRAGSSSSAANSNAEDIDVRFRRWLQRVGGRGDRHREGEPKVLVSVFESEGPKGTAPASISGTAVRVDDIAEDLEDVHAAMKENLYPKMIAKGSSGSYFVRIRDKVTKKPRIVAVFKPSNEEPYGTLNPKRIFLRKYFWWAMGRPCLVPNFSAFSEVGASYLDERLDLNMVPRTRLVSLASPTFHYEYKDRLRWERGQRSLPDKVGSFQRFLDGYVNASEFLRAHPWPSRPRSMLESDLAAEQRARKATSKARNTKARGCWSSVKRVLLCRQGLETDVVDRLIEDDGGDVGGGGGGNNCATAYDEDSWVWTTERMRDFRLELERLVVLDYLMRNTDRSLDNFMVKRRDPASEPDGHPRAHRSIVVAAIDNSLSFPHTHPNGIREYPYGWLWCPVDLIGGPFSEETRLHFLPLLSSPEWWVGTVRTLRDVFKQDEHFDDKVFARQMEILKGQGWNIVQSLKSVEEGPLELCTRQKRLIKQDVVHVSASELGTLSGTRVKLVEQPAPFLPSSVRSALAPASDAKPLPVPTPVDGGAAKKEASAGMAAGAHPRSLPETTDWKGMAGMAGMASIASLLDAGAPSDGPTAPAAAAYSPQLPRRGSLGIEVLDKIDRAARKARRPAFAKRLSSMAAATRPSVADRRSASHGDVGADAAPAAPETTTPSAAAMLASVASLPDTQGDTQRGRSTAPVVHDAGGAEAAMPASSAGRPRRARGWSIASLASLRAGTEAPLLPNTHEDVRVPVLVERFEVDSSRAWLSWY